ncbi:MAG TPA: hypothetical protein ENH40_01960 [Nitrospirae bacterium]|nr:hypothetical protein [Nitrospirota bacterium]
MKKKHFHTFPGYVIHGFLFVGLVSAFAFRSLIVFQRIEPSWVRPVWYAGVIGYIGFFLYRYTVTKRRKRVVKEYGLIDKVNADTCFSEEDRDAITFLLASIQRSREDINYLVIFLLSVLAVLTDLIFVFYY